MAPACIQAATASASGFNVGERRARKSSGKRRASFRGFKHVIEEPRTRERIFHVTVEGVCDLLLGRAVSRLFADHLEKFAELRIDYRLEESFPGRKVVVNGHWSEAERARDAPHDHGLRAAPLEQAKRSAPDTLLRGHVGRHPCSLLYDV